ncbi:MAG: metallophosphoesterase [Candidatus Marinimicrobia bacterium]|jgi:predicted phosphodiesterase|nr:metallophosphoesterase [Candidatus Neomarinimicrobiota bacterium]|tara:strand:- start:710 stop:1399 length:690 start_codon:yes stop_codon:yes gene_type:complete
MLRRYDKRNILVMGCTHIPFTQEGYLEHCLKVRKEKKCGTVVHLGDLVDNLGLTMRDLDPDGHSPNDEILLARKKLKEWFLAFPELKFTLGNHDLRLARKAKKGGIPSIAVRKFSEIWKLPDKWEVDLRFVIDGVGYEHGSSTGQNAHRELAIYNRMPAAQAHSHAFAGVAYTASPKDCIWGLNSGCGIDNSAIAFAYGKHFKVKPIVSCATVENGKNPQIFKMELGLQ